MTELSAPSETRAVTASDIHGDLMQAFREGRYQPGAQLPNERQLAEAYGASRQQVRDALLILQEAGLVERKVGSGTYLSKDAPAVIERIDAEVDVHAIHEHSFLETVEARLVLEPGVAALAARNITPEGLEHLKQALEAVRAPASWLDVQVAASTSSRAPTTRRPATPSCCGRSTRFSRPASTTSLTGTGNTASSPRSCAGIHTGSSPKSIAPSPIVTKAAPRR